MKKNNQIESLRAIAIFMIIIYHYLFRFNELFGISMINNTLGIGYWGRIGVGIFFILSGCFIIPESTMNFNLMEYYKKKIIRLYPPYIICISITFILMHIFKLPGRKSSILDYILNLFLINGFIGTDYVDGAYWYLTYIIVFIAIMGIIIKLNLHKKNWFFILWFVVGTILNIYCKNNLNVGKIMKLALLLIGGSYFPCIIIGITLKKMTNKKNKFSLEISILIVSLITILLLRSYIEFISSIVSCGVIYLSLNRKLRFLEINLLSYIGGISYELYLLHQNIGYIILLGYINNLGSPNILLYSVIILIVILLSILINKYWNPLTLKLVEDVNRSGIYIFTKRNKKYY